MSWTKKRTLQEIKNAQMRIQQLEDAKLLLNEKIHAEAFSAINQRISHWKEAIEIWRKKHKGLPTENENGYCKE
ncbi:hypothetical protein ACFVS2_25695 [Brevibacillus sp. NPDC058079]|uniref:hypothetical protein n=1 Tax=Brevibacillus sp. NPDC058079 TaxID=3346330 RepID=UPI0036EE70C1